MAKRKVSREFNLEYSDLVMKCESTIAVALRDKDELVTMGFTNDKRLQFQAQLDAFKLISTDDFMMGQQIFRTQEKDNARLAVEKSLRIILTIAENTFGANAGKYKQFGGANLTVLTDDNLVRYSVNAAATATLLLSELQPEGVTPEIIATLRTKTLTLDQAVNNKIAAIRQREIATEDRTDKGNQLYHTLNKLCNIGKTLWYDINEAKYNDYIIYDAPANHSSKALNPEFTGILAGTVADNQTNAPIIGAVLALNGTQLTATSDEYGEFSMDNIPQGTYTLNATAGGYQSVVRTNIVIKADEQADVNVRMGRVG